jgi:hypothetical protein
MPIHRRAALDALHLDGVLSPDVNRGVAAIDLAQKHFVDAYALVGLACFIASAARDGTPVDLALPEDPDVRSWHARMHLGDVSTPSRSGSRERFPGWPSGTAETP